MNVCPLCSDTGGELIYREDLFRVVIVDEAKYPGFVRLIVNQHVKEMTDLSYNESLRVFSALLKIENIIRQLYCPDKINLASLGNVVPHLHWHIIPRYFTDLHFPNPIWGEVTHPDYNPDNALSQLHSSLVSQLSDVLVAG